MKKLSLILLVLFFAVSCGKDDDSNKSACNYTNPIEELSWLKAIKNSMTNCSCEMSILQATYNQQTVFYVSMTDPLCDGLQTTILLNCEGKIVEVIQPEKFQEFLSKITSIRNLYRCKTSI